MADHPYRHAEDRAFWSRSVASNFDPGAVPDPPPFRLGQADRFMSAGSCFGANVRRYIEAWGLDYTVTERPHPQWPETAEKTFYEAFSARYGNIYTARQMAQLLMRVLGEFSPQEDHWLAPDGTFIDPFRPGLLHRASSLNELRALTGQHLRAVRRAVEVSTVIVFTLGLTEAWISAGDGAVFPACPGTVAGEYDPERHHFVNFAVEEVTADLHLVVKLLRVMNPSIKVVLTVSPVPMIATASGRHVITATGYSKSVLRVAADQAVRHNRDVAYFPGYEMTLWPHRGDSPFADDMRTVSEPVLAEVMSGFRAAFIEPGETNGARDREQDQSEVTGAVAAALDDVCEEMMADEALSMALSPR